MDAFDAYVLYIAVKTHFTSKKYDFHKNNGKVKVSVSSFESRSDRAFFYKISSHYSKAKLTDLFVANFVDNPSMWIGDFMAEEADMVYLNWQKRVESLSYLFQEESTDLLTWIQDNDLKLNDIFRVNQSDHPLIVKMALQKTITLETFIIMDKLFGFGTRVDSKLDDIIWRDLWLKTKKYSAFLNIPDATCRTFLRNKIETEYQSVIS